MKLPQLSIPYWNRWKKLDIGSILLIVSILILAALFVIRPFIMEQVASTGSDNLADEETRLLDHRYSALLAEKERLLNTVHELEIDYGMGKVPEEDYPGQRAELLSAGARVLQELDEIEAQSQKNAPEILPEHPMVDLQEAEIINGMDGIEEMVVARKRLRDEKSAGFCPHCGKVIQKSDVYCPRCGSKVVA
jgi:hypothetical protein